MSQMALIWLGSGHWLRIRMMSICIEGIHLKKIGRMARLAAPKSTENGVANVNTEFSAGKCQDKGRLVEGKAAGLSHTAACSLKNMGRGEVATAMVSSR